jgi:hypothetical protein
MTRTRLNRYDGVMNIWPSKKNDDFNFFHDPSPLNKWYQVLSQQTISNFCVVTTCCRQLRIVACGGYLRSYTQSSSIASHQFQKLQRDTKRGWWFYKLAIFLSKMECGVKSVAGRRYFTAELTKLLISVSITVYIISYSTRSFQVRLKFSLTRTSINVHSVSYLTQIIPYCFRVNYLRIRNKIS